MPSSMRRQMEMQSSAARSFATGIWPEPDRSLVYFDTMGKRWIYRKKFRRSGWQVGSSEELRSWQTAIQVHWAGMPVRASHPLSEEEEEKKDFKKNRGRTNQPVLRHRRRGNRPKGLPPVNRPVMPQPALRRPSAPVSRPPAPDLETVAEELRHELRGPF